MKRIADVAAFCLLGSAVNKAAACLRDGGARITGKDQHLRQEYAAVAAVGQDGSPITLATIPTQQMRTLARRTRQYSPKDLIHKNIGGNAILTVGTDPTMVDWMLALECLDQLPRKAKHGSGGPPSSEYAQAARHTAVFEQVCQPPVGTGDKQIMDMAVAGGKVSAKQLEQNIKRFPRNLAINAKNDPGGTCGPLRTAAKLPARLPE